MKLWAISDLHIGSDVNRQAIAALAPRPEDWLILAGDVGDRRHDLAFVFETLAPRFAKLFWVPGNHELWTERHPENAPAGVARYDELVTLARAHAVGTPEDDYLDWPVAGPRAVIAPMTLRYDYSFRPQG